MRQAVVRCWITRVAVKESKRPSVCCREAIGVRVSYLDDNTKNEIERESQRKSQRRERESARERGEERWDSERKNETVRDRERQSQRESQLEGEIVSDRFSESSIHKIRRRRERATEVRSDRKNKTK